MYDICMIYVLVYDVYILIYDIIYHKLSDIHIIYITYDIRTLNN